MARDWVGSELLASRHGSMFEVEHKIWYNTRKTVVRLFSARSFNTLFLNTMKKAIQLSFESIDKQIELGKPFDIQPILFQWTFRMAMSVFFGLERTEETAALMDELEATYVSPSCACACV
jgi:cytochrome P450